MEFIIRNHLTPISLFKAHKFSLLTRQAITSFFINGGEYSPDLLIHFMACATQEERSLNQSCLMEFANHLIRFYFDVFKKIKSKPPLLTGNDLIKDLNLAPSHDFKVILDLVEKARLSQQIKTREQALDLAKSWVQKNNS